MKFLSVLCVVLYFRSGDFFQIQNNVLPSSYQNQRPVQLDSQRNLGISYLNNGYNNAAESQINNRFAGQLNSQENLRFRPPQISPEYINSQQRFNEQPLNQGVNRQLQNEYFQDQSVYRNPQELHSIYVNSEVRNINNAQVTPGVVNSRPQLQLQDSLNYVPQQIYNKPAQNILHINPGAPPALTYPKNINTQSIGHGNIAPLISNEDTKLELQGISPEFIQSVINQNNMPPKNLKSVQPRLSLPKSYENERSIEGPNENIKFRFDQHRARFANPSAEVLYSTEQALPYNIQSQQLPKITQGDSEVTFRNSVLSTRNIGDIIRSTPPVKRFMIIHPGGRVEHVDDIEKITKMHPNYSMINSQDILKYLNGKSTIPGLQIPQPKQSIPVKNYQPIPTINQERNPVPYLTEQKINKILSSQISNVTPQKDLVTEALVPSSVIPSKTLPTEDITNKNGSINIQQKINELSSKDIDRNVTTNSSTVPLTSVVSSIAQNGSDFKRELIITHSSPIIKTEVIQNSQNSSENLKDNFPTQNQQQNSLNITLSTENNRNETVVKSSTPLTSSTVSTTTEISDERKNHTQLEKVDFVDSKNSTIQPLNEEEIYTSEETSEYDSANSPIYETASSVQITGDNNITITDISYPEFDNSSEGVVYDIEHVYIANNNATSNNTESDTPSVLLTSLETHKYSNNNNSAPSEPESSIKALGLSPVPLLNETEVPVNVHLYTNIDVTSGEIPSDDENESSPLENSSESGGFWFQADDHFWEDIRNNNDGRNLFYFLFAPPKQNIVEKETKTTIYANGTTVEEISETRNEDGVPTVVRSTKVTHANSTSTDV